ncbi:MAG: malate synthase G, partial [Mesorhizobium sp.]
MPTAGKHPYGVPAHHEVHWLRVADELFEFMNHEALPGTGVDSSAFWASFSSIVHDLAPRNGELLQIREMMQKKIDHWHRGNSSPKDLDAYKTFLREIDYIVPEGPDFSVSTSNVDPEIATIAGPQLVVPVMNARYALNAANARWGSLYDALYGTDAIPEAGGAEKGSGYNPVRGDKVIGWARKFLDESVPLVSASWSDVKAFAVAGAALAITTVDGKSVELKAPDQFAGYRGEIEKPTHFLLKNNGIHIEIVIDSNSVIGKADVADISDIRLESAITAIMDCEDSVAAVDGEDKVTVYRNWLGLMKGDLTEEITKGGKTFTRRLEADIDYAGPDGTPFALRARSLMLVRNVGHLMTNPAVLDRDGNEVPEGVMDAMMTAAIALHDIGEKGRRANSAAGSMYVVKPKMHGPAEVA